MLTPDCRRLYGDLKVMEVAMDSYLTGFSSREASALQNVITTPEMEKPVDLVTNGAYSLFLRTTLLLRVSIIICGIWTNAVNMRAFRRMGLDDSVTIVFFLIAISDFLLLIGGLMDAIIEIITIPEFGYDELLFPPAIVGYLITLSSRGFSETTYLSTTFLALQRCLCVVKPLLFKGMFSRLRTAVIMSSIWLFAFVFTILAVVYNSKIRLHFDPSLNGSRFVADFIPGRDVVMNVYTTTFSIVLNTFNQVVVTGCVFIMAHALKKSVRFRLMTSVSGVPPGGSLQKDGTSGHDKQQERSTSSVAGAKERLAILQVALVSAIFLVCNSVRLAVAFSSVIEPQFDIHGYYYLTFMLCYTTMAMFESINSSVNFFIYYKYNSKFRSICFGPK